MLQRILKYETTIKVPLKAHHYPAKPRFERYLLQRRGMIAKLLKPKQKAL